MGRVRLLDEQTINHIAAGEVVERPASVVKELVENSLDAGARSVRVEISGGGRGIIRVIDDGSGMDQDDALLSLERHATSKIHQASDIGACGTLGFRGEALPSIASVSRLEMVTRTKHSASATRIEVEAGRVASVSEVGASTGTTVTVRDLFYNTPARAKFLKTDARETARAVEVVIQAALSAPSVRFSAIVDGKQMLSTPGTGNLLDAIASLYGVEFARSLTSVSCQVGSVSVTGFTGKASLSRSHRGEQHFFVNGRVVKDSGIRWALEEAYSGSMPRGRYPVAFLCIDLDPDDLDVNVHPAKTEVRFRDDKCVRRAVLTGVSRAVGAALGAPAASDVHVTNTASPYPRETAAAHASESRGSYQAVEQPGYQPSFLQLARPKDAASPSISELRPIGYLLGTYIVASAYDTIALVDQHAAHERINYEHIRQRLARKERMVQPLLMPRTVELGAAERVVLREHMEALSALGYDIETFGGSTVIVRSSVSVSGIDICFEAVLDRLLKDAPIAVEEWPGERACAALAACSASVKAGDHLDLEGQQALITSLASAVEPMRCPHGRPTVIFITRDEIERRFGRK